MMEGKKEIIHKFLFSYYFYLLKFTAQITDTTLDC